MGTKKAKTSHAGKGKAKHEGEKALHTAEIEIYNHDVDSKQEENSQMATQMLEKKPLLSLLELVQQPSEPPVIGLESLAPKRKGFLTLSWSSDYDWLIILRSIKESEYYALAESHGIPVDEALKGFYFKLQQWQPDKPPIWETPEDCPVTDSQIALLRSLSHAESCCHQAWIDLYIGLPSISEMAPIADTNALNECLDWLCEEDLVQLKTEIDKRLKHCPESVSNAQILPKATIPELVMSLVSNNVLEPLNVQIAKTISHPKHYRHRYDALKTLGQDKTEYGMWLKNLVNEYYEQDYTCPATEWGLLQRLKSMSLTEFIQDLKQIDDPFFKKSLVEIYSANEILELYEQILNVSFTDESREEFYVECGLKGKVQEFIVNLLQACGSLFEKYRDFITPLWTDLSHPCNVGDNGLEGAISDWLAAPPDLLAFLVNEQTKNLIFLQCRNEALEKQLQKEVG